MEERIRQLELDIKVLRQMLAETHLVAAAFRHVAEKELGADEQWRESVLLLAQAGLPLLRERFATWEERFRKDEMSEDETPEDDLPIF